MDNFIRMYMLLFLMGNEIVIDYMLVKIDIFIFMDLEFNEL